MKLNQIFNETLETLEAYKENNPDDAVFSSIENQIKFVHNCYINNLNIKDSLNGKELTYNILASRNLVQPNDKVLLGYLEKITEYVIQNIK